MSEANIANALRAIEAYNVGGFDATMEFFASDVEVVPDAAAFLESVPLHGQSGSGRGWRRPPRPG